MTGDCVAQPHAVITLSVTLSLRGLLSRARDNAQDTGTYTRVPSAAHQTLWLHVCGLLWAATFLLRVPLATSLQAPFLPGSPCRKMMFCMWVTLDYHEYQVFFLSVVLPSEQVFVFTT